MKYIIEKFDGYILVSKVNTIKDYEYDYIYNLQFKYNYIYKSSNKPKIVERFNGSYSKYIFSNIKIDHLFYLYDTGCFRFMKNVKKETSLYNIKDKIEMI
jgi:hypothetical protein